MWCATIRNKLDRVTNRSGSYLWFGLLVEFVLATMLKVLATMMKVLATMLKEDLVKQ